MTETDRLRAVAQYCRTLANSRRVQNKGEAARWHALADLFDGLAHRHFRYTETTCHGCLHDWPCMDLKAALAVADALGIE